MLSKAQIKYIRSLTQQKFRREHKAFVAEGDKMVQEWLRSSAPVKMIVCVAGWAEAHKSLIAQHEEATLHVVEDHVLEALTTMQTPNQALVVAALPEAQPVPMAKEWYMALDDIQDPGNMGTIIRVADWFGIRHIVCSPGCVDVYNHKVIQSAMGGHLRVNLYESDLADFLAAVPVPVIAATLDGTDVYKTEQLPNGVLVIGNESKGVSAAVAELARYKITIPRRGGAESLNAGVSAGILCALLLRS